MKLVIDLPSALIGAGVLALVGVAVAAQDVSPMKRDAVEIPATAFGDAPIKVVGIPDPRDIIRITEGTPYVVPTAQRLVLTAMGSDEIAVSSRVDLMVDGSVAARFVPPTTGTTLWEIPTHLIVNAGAVVEPDGTNGLDGQGYALGYLIDG